MFDIINNNLRTKLLLLFASAVTFIMFAVWYGLTSMSSVVDKYEDIVHTDVKYSSQIATLNVDFKIQVQEWKNTLIRGKSTEQRDKYWGRFNSRADKIQAEYEELLPLIGNEHPAYDDLAAFARSYPPMISAYRDGYQAFVDAGFDIPVGDKAVSGIDREPSKRLTEAVKKMSTQFDLVKEQMAKHAANTFFYTMVQLVIATCIGLYGFYWFISSKILQPLNEVTKVSRSIAAGDFTCDINLSGNDQIGQLASDFKLIQSDLGRMIGDIVRDVDKLRAMTQQLFSAFSNVKDSLHNQKLTTASVSQSMNDMTQIVESIGSSVEQANQCVTHSTEQTSAGLDMFKSSVETSQSMLDATNSASDIIVKLKKDSDDIGGVVSVINGVAEQTNLLALNAAIEAARAGESGRGFAVVADEVRSLATKTQESTELISRNIHKLQQAADSAVNAMTEGTEKASTSVEQTKQSQKFMLELAEVFAEIAKLNAQVDEAVSSQSTQSGRVNDGLTHISSLGDHSQNQAQEMEKVSSELATVLEHISQSTQRFKLR